MRPVVLLTAFAFLAGCVGEIGELLDRPTSASELVCGQRPELHRLSGVQYRAVVDTLLAGSSAAATAEVPFAQARRADFFSTWSRQAGIGEYEIDEVWNAADAVARAWASDPGNVCPAAERSACVGRVWADALRTLWSRPATELELAEVSRGLEDAETELTAQEATTALMRGALMSPAFLFRGEGLQGKLTGDEIAAALAFTLLDRPPDDVLRAFGATQPDADAIRAEVKRLLAAPSMVPALRGFVRELFQYGRAVETQKDLAAHPFHHARELVDDSERVIERLLDDHATSGLLRALLTSDLVFVRASTAQSWALATQAEEGTYLHEPSRVGLLTHPSWLVAMSHPEQNHLVRRGLFVRERLLCGSVPPIPGGVVPQIPDVPGRSLRERIAEHSSNPACSTCHHLMDPLASGFEAWDHLGRPRTVDNGAAVDMTGELLGAGDDKDGAYADARDLMGRLADSEVVKACWVTQLYRFVHGRDIRESDQCELDRLAALYDSSGEDTLAVIAEMFASPEYLERTTITSETNR
ncbi:MAG: DUF1588 domain-containing protein [Myxococcota bacterium]